MQQKMEKQKSHSSSNSNDDRSEMSYYEQFKQQMFKSWLPVPTITKTIILFFIMSAVFIGIGIPMMVLSNQIVQVRFRYDNSCTINSICTMTFQIPKTMTSPVFVYYELNNYFQNHRLYSNSISTDQLAGKVLTVSELSTYCSPIITNSQLYVTKALDNTTLDPKEPANPCGIIAYSIFNDSFSISDPNGNSILMTTNGIAWPSDLQKYKLSNLSAQWYNVTDPRFMNWMRLATLPDFRKLWARINSDLSPGTYSVQITNNFDVSSFNSFKYLVLSTSSFFGGKNDFLAILYLVIGALCFAVGVIFLIKRVRNQKNKEN